jgi:hypothetical protein
MKECRDLAVPWFLCFIAGLLEVAWPIGLTHTKGSGRLRPSVGTLAAMALSARLGCVGLIVAGIILETAVGRARVGCDGLAKPDPRP